MDIIELGKRKADNAVTFIQQLKHVKDPWHGKNFMLLPWQERDIRTVYGTLKADGTRQYTKALLEVPKKSGKSEQGAALALLHLCADNEMFGEIYGCAADKGQASIIFDVAVEMVEQEPMLKSRIKPILSRKRLVYLPTKSFYEVLSAEAFTKHGKNVSCCIFDELHAQPNRDLWDVMTFGAGDAREQPFWWVLTTSGADPDRTSIGWEIHKKAEDILLGNRVDSTMYPVIYGVDFDERRIWTGRQFELMAETDTWETRRLWKMVNPSLGVTVKEHKLDEAYASAKGNEAEKGLFRQLRLNEWVKFKIAKWLSLEIWDKNKGTIDLESLKGRKCYGGMDLSEKNDITAFVLVFPPESDGEKYIILPFFWIPEEYMKARVKRDKVPYDIWAKQGFIMTTPGNYIDYAFLRKTINDLGAIYDIQEIGYDQYNTAKLAPELENEDGYTMIVIRQGALSMSEPMKSLKGMLLDEKMNHGGNPVLRWMFGNLEVRIDENENIRPVKGKSVERIDGIVALINAMARLVVHIEKKSIYNERGVICL